MLGGWQSGKGEVARPVYTRAIGEMADALASGASVQKDVRVLKSPRCASIVVNQLSKCAYGRCGQVLDWVWAFKRKPLLYSVYGAHTTSKNRQYMPLERTPHPTPLQRILRFVKSVTPVLALARALSAISRRVNSAVHKLQFLIEWGVDNPEHFDHFLEQHYSWRKDKYSIGWERGVLSSIALQKKDQKLLPRVLELCCGDGFNTLHFYSVHAASITAVDFDVDAIANARKRNSAKNIDYQLCDIRTQIPVGLFENIIWDAAIEHFTDLEVEGIFTQIITSLVPGGMLSGYTLLENDDGGMHLHQHEREFSSKDDLARLLSPHFKNVHVLQTSMPTRENLYFFASNGPLPFEDAKNPIIKKP